MLSGLDMQVLGIYDGGYLCFKCAGRKYGELRTARVAAGFDSLPEADVTEPRVPGWSVRERIVEAEEDEREGNEGDWWGTTCDDCGAELSPAPVSGTAEGGHGA